MAVVIDPELDSLASAPCVVSVAWRSFTATTPPSEYSASAASSSSAAGGVTPRSVLRGIFLLFSWREGVVKNAFCAGPMPESGEEKKSDTRCGDGADMIASISKKLRARIGAVGARA